MKKLEICCYSVDDALIAQQGGADRIELCTGRFDGGLTPSAGQLIETKKKLVIPTHVIIRPRGGDFCYTKRELSVMKNDIAYIKELGFSGIVVGVVNNEGDIDIMALQFLMESAEGLSITFHRAFDMCRNPYLSLSQLTDLGIHRILTSGQKQAAIQGLPLILSLCEQSKGPIIMPGAGIRPDNIHYFKHPLIQEIHSSASCSYFSVMRYRNHAIKMGQEQRDEFLSYRTDLAAVQSMKTQWTTPKLL